MIQAWLAKNALKLGGIAVMCLASFFYGCHEEAKNTKAVQAAFDKFSDGVREAGEKAEADKIAKEKADLALKEKTDEVYKRAITELRDRVNRMLLARARSSYLPEPTTAAGSPEDITFDRAGLEREIQRLDARVQELIVEGSEAQRKLDIAVKWAAEWSAR